MKKPHAQDFGADRTPHNNHGILFFRPNKAFVSWLKDYAGNRTICEVGSGTGHLLKMLQDVQQRCWGIEPTWDSTSEIKAALSQNREVLQVIPRPAEQTDVLTQITKDNTLVIFARPSHSLFVERTIDMLQKGVEVLYITLPENLYDYIDLGKYQSRGKKIKHNGTSQENEVVISLIK
ncbi:MAG TPA: hypothetical protein VGM30_24810 [Puia sp.]|jgi:hypothetical protein